MTVCGGTGSRPLSLCMDPLRHRESPFASGSGRYLVFSVWWGGGEAPVGSAGELPAVVVDGPMMGSADQGQVGQVGGAAVQPVPDMVGFAPGQRPMTAREDAAAVADGQGAV